MGSAGTPGLQGWARTGRGQHGDGELICCSPVGQGQGWEGRRAGLVLCPVPQHGVTAFLVNFRKPNVWRPKWLGRNLIEEPRPSRGLGHFHLHCVTRS